MSWDVFRVSKQNNLRVHDYLGVDGPSRSFEVFEGLGDRLLVLYATQLPTIYWAGRALMVPY